MEEQILFFIFRRADPFLVLIFGETDRSFCFPCASHISPYRPLLLPLPVSHLTLPPTRVDDVLHPYLSHGTGHFVRTSKQFRWLAASTGISSALAAGFILQVGRRVPHWDVVGIWGGITGMFALRLLATIWRVLDRKRGPYWVLGSDADGAKKSS